MFKANTSHLQQEFFSAVNQLSKDKKAKLMASAQWQFYLLIFCQIDESLFTPLYSKKGSRPNAPVNAMVSALILKHHYGWTFQELFEHIDFSLLTRAALGVSDLDTTPFASSTLFDFQQRLFEYDLQTGDNLFERVFDQLTAHQLARLKLKTSIQRTDSVLIASNIRDFSRLQLLVEVLLRLHRILSEADQAELEKLLAPYLKQGSGSKYVYRLTRDTLPDELRRLGQVYQQVWQFCRTCYAETEIFCIFQRVYTEHFTIADAAVTVVPAKELSGSIIQSPDDPEATYRTKGDTASKGYVVNAVETAHPDNDLNLLVDVAVESNTTDDAALLNSRLDGLIEKTPALNEMHGDGGFGSKETDKKFAELGMTQIQTAIKGRKAAVEITIIATGEQTWQVTCPQQHVESQPTITRFKACFNKTTCSTCPHAESCPAQEQKNSRTFYFTSEDAARNARHRRIKEIPVERRTLRNNVEATMREFVNRLDGHRVRVRGKFKTALFAYGRAIGINFGRIFRYECLTTGEASA
jgi:hypothetical protein